MNLQNLACVHERERERESKHLHGFVKLLFSFILATTLFLTVHHSVYAATSYIDGALSGDCTGNYSVSSRNCTGSNGNAYITVSTGVGAASAGDTINIRAGTYAINGSVTVNFSSAATTTIQAYNSENVTLTNSSVSS
ncbi:MAG: Fibronectin type III domain-like protein, partial [Parcubacteria group bacterium GW2011_GWC1_43_11]